MPPLSAAQLPPHLADTGIFSPSVARVAASTARDWNYVDGWLASHFRGRAPPAFERSAETLKALLALASLNEAADEERELLAQSEAAALRELREAESRVQPEESGEDGTGEAWTSAFVESVEASLTREGRVALDTLATTAVDLGVAYPEPEQLAGHLVELQGRAFSLEQDLQRVRDLQGFLRREAEEAERVPRELENPEYKPPTGLARENLDLQRKIKAVAATIPELTDRAASLSAPEGGHVTVEQLAQLEAQYLELSEVRERLSAQVASFQGLPSDTDMARAELETMRSKLGAETRKRDAVFEGLVEASSPRKKPGRK